MAGSPQQRGSRPRLARLLRGPGAIPPACGEVEAAAEARRRPMGASPPPLLPPPPPSPQRQELAPSRPRAHPRSSLRPPLARPGPPRLPTPHPPSPPRPPAPELASAAPSLHFPPPSSSGGGGRDGSAQSPPTPGGGLSPPLGVSAARAPPTRVTPGASAFPFKKTEPLVAATAAAAADRRAHAPGGKQEGANRERRGGRRAALFPTLLWERMKFFVSKGSRPETEGPLVPRGRKIHDVCSRGSCCHNLPGMKYCQLPTVLSQRPSPQPS